MKKFNTTGIYILEKNGDVTPCDDILKWGVWFEKADRTLRYTTFSWGRVSTVFLGIDHAPSYGDGPPVLFETLVFGGPMDGDMSRYTTMAAALQGHNKIVKDLSHWWITLQLIRFMRYVKFKMDGISWVNERHEL